MQQTQEEYDQAGVGKGEHFECGVDSALVVEHQLLSGKGCVEIMNPNYTVSQEEYDQAGVGEGEHFQFKADSALAVEHQLSFLFGNPLS